MPPGHTRRAVLGAAGAATAALAGCSTPGASGGSGDEGPPTTEPTTPLPYDLAAVQAARTNGGVGRDDIPAIDDPEFEHAAAADRRLADGDVVFGVRLGGEVRAYPRRVMVWHEVCNDVVGGVPVVVTYCPLTGSALGFERGPTRFGVSGALVNSNLIMFDRGAGSRWPQILGRAITGPLEGRALKRVPVVWTTWGRWRDAHPDTRVLTPDTGYVRDYGGDPYGSYNPPSGYYGEGPPVFPVMDHDTNYDPGTAGQGRGAKVVVVGAPTPDGGVAFNKDGLRAEGVVVGEVRGARYLAAYDPTLDAGHVYANPDGTAFEYEAGRVGGPDGTHAPDDLPLERVHSFDAMWFAWWGFYPNFAVYG